MTGAGGAIGASVAGELARRGRRLVLVDSDASALGAVAEHGVPMQADLTSDEEVSELVRRTVAEVGVPTACVNAAGIEGPVAPVEELALEEVARVYDVNVFAIFRTLRALLPHFKRHGSGRVVNIASGAGLGGVAYMSAYSSSKHAVVGITRSVAAEVAADNVSVNAVCPGCVESPMMARIEGRLAASFRDAIPMRRYAEPSEVAGIVAYLICDAPPYLTGASLVVDGGLRA